MTVGHKFYKAPPSPKSPLGTKENLHTLTWRDPHPPMSWYDFHHSCSLDNIQITKF